MFFFFHTGSGAAILAGATDRREEEHVPQFCGRIDEKFAEWETDVRLWQFEFKLEDRDELVTDPAKLNGQKVLYAVLAANTAGRARFIVREDNTKNGAWAWARLRERSGRDSGATSFTEVFQDSWPSEKPFEDMWRDWVKKVSKLPTGSLSSQANEQLTISGLSRHGQPELENHWRLRAPLAWQDIQTQVEKYPSKIIHQQSPQPMDISAVLTGQNARVVEARHQRKDC